MSIVQMNCDCLDIDAKAMYVNSTCLSDEVLEGRRLRVGEGEVLADRRHQRVLRLGLEMNGRL